MDKILLIDADGVLQYPNSRFPDLLQDKFGCAGSEYYEFLQDLFNNSEEYQRSLQGKGSFLVALKEKLDQWRLNIKPELFMRFWFEHNIVVDQYFMQQISKFRSESVRVYLASNQEINRAEFMTDHFNLNNRLDGCFFSYQLGCSKPNPSYFNKISSTLRCDNSQLLFVDDNLCNVEAAQSVGIKSIHHLDAKTTLLALQNYLAG